MGAAHPGSALCPEKAPALSVWGGQCWVPQAAVSASSVLTVAQEERKGRESSLQTRKVRPGVSEQWAAQQLDSGPGLGQATFPRHRAEVLRPELGTQTKAQPLNPDFPSMPSFWVLALFLAYGLGNVL